MGKIKGFAGRIRFNHSHTISIAVQYVRKKGTHVSVRFNNAIKWPTMLEEQRRVPAGMKPVPKDLW